MNLPATPASFGGELDVDPLCPDDVATPSDRAKDAQGLTMRQAAFVEAFLSNGGKKREAAESAGYAPGPGAGVAATRALSLPRVQEALLRRVRQARIESAVKAMKRLDKLLTAKSEYVRLEAAKELVKGALSEHGGGSVTAKIEIDLG